MRFTMDISNAAQRLITSFQKNDPNLKKYALAFVMRKPQSKYLLPVLESEQWKEFALERKDLSNEILKQILQ